MNLERRTTDLDRIRARTQLRTRLEGRKAFAEKVPLCSCPYFEHASKAEWWREGYVEALRMYVQTASQEAQKEIDRRQKSTKQWKRRWLDGIGIAAFLLGLAACLVLITYCTEARA